MKPDMGQVPSGLGNLVSKTEPKQRNLQKFRQSKRRTSRKKTTILPPPIELSEFTPHRVEVRIPNSIPEEAEQNVWMKSLWDEIQEANAKR